MKLKKLLDGIYDGEIDSRFAEVNILSISCDSRKVIMGGLFVALQGHAHNGLDYVEEALNRGVFAIATSGDIQQMQEKYPDVCFLRANNINEFLHKVVQRLYGNPSENVRTIGITGTNGKTTVAYVIEAIITEDKKECGVIGTINYRLAQTIAPAKQTTPSFLDNQHFLTGLDWQHVPYCVMEVSSHALTQDRVFGIDFKGAIFTNLTSDHLDYHKTREEYFLAKSLLFTGLGPKSTAVINTDDPYGQRLLGMTKANIVTYGIEHKADVMARDIQMDIEGSRFTLVSPAGEIEMETELVGTYNIYNVLSAIALCLAEKIGLKVIQQGIAHLGPVPGRLERVDLNKEFFVFIDYAHTQDALKNVLETIRKISQAKIILVFGCGGDRDTSKRSLMGQVAGQLADFSFVTSDNPRSEDPQSIIDQIIPGFERNNYEVVIDRKEAIGRALKMAQAGDTVLIAGKGHETYQVLADGRVDFNERTIVEEFFPC